MPEQIPIKLPEMWAVGPGGLVVSKRVVAVARWGSAPIRRAARAARAGGLLLDLTYGHVCKWVLFLDSGHVVLGTEPIPLSIVNELAGEPGAIQKNEEE